MSMKTTKYKLSDMAKDLKVTNNDLIECLGKLGGELQSVRIKETSR